ncbi:MAG: GTPase HflX [Oscillospiraceae bacterium]|nr:GTPase HflX [Oscillospiraceae bacterium]
MTFEKETERAILCGVHTGSLDVLSDTTDETMAELRELARTAGAEVVGIMVQNRDKPEGATYFGEGKIEELKAAVEAEGATLIIFDDELTGSQIRNIEDAAGARVIDRSTLILDIFAQRARSKEGKLQVELAQLRYNLPRLIGMGQQLSRLGGGIGTRGPGETKLESDRRHIHRRIESLENELKEVEKHRGLLRSRRSKDGVATAALVGYTNAGKSSLMNRITNSDIFAENMLFATLDPTVRALELSDGRNACMIDTVGFIRKLPHHLIKAFRSTLEEACEADVLLHVIDAADPELQNHIRVVDELLSELGCKAQRTIAVFNKSDIAPPLSPRPKGEYTDYAFVSAATGEGIESLMTILEDALPGKKRKVTVLIPYAQSGTAAKLHDGEVILAESYENEGTRITLMADPALYARIKEFEVTE